VTISISEKLALIVPTFSLFAFLFPFPFPSPSSLCSASSRATCKVHHIYKVTNNVPSRWSLRLKEGGILVSHIIFPSHPLVLLPLPHGHHSANLIPLPSLPSFFFFLNPFPSHTHYFICPFRSSPLLFSWVQDLQNAVWTVKIVDRVLNNSISSYVSGVLLHFEWPNHNLFQHKTYVSKDESLLFSIECCHRTCMMILCGFSVYLFIYYGQLFTPVFILM